MPQQKPVASRVGTAHKPSKPKQKDFKLFDSTAVLEASALAEDGAQASRFSTHACDRSLYTNDRIDGLDRVLYINSQIIR